MKRIITMGIPPGHIYRLLRMDFFQSINQVSHSSKIMPRYIIQKWPGSGTKSIIFGWWVSHPPTPIYTLLNMYEGVLKHELYQLYPNFHELKNNTAEMKIFTFWIKKAWKCVDQEHIRRLVTSIPARLNVYRDAKGWYTKYWLELFYYPNIVIFFFLVYITWDPIDLRVHEMV